MINPLRKSGIDIIGDVPWGTHFCQFYETKDDLVDILVPYFKTGLENNEFCMWVTSEPLGVEEAKQSLGKLKSDINSFFDNKQLEIIPYTEWYVRYGVFDSERVLNGWVDRLNTALDNGFDGLRLTGNTFWLEKEDWKDFVGYEEEVDRVIGSYQMIAMCTYCLDKCNANEIIDVVNNHQFALIKRRSEWTLVESAKQKEIKEELKSTQNKYHSLFNHMLDGYAHCEMIYDNQGNPTDFRYLNVNATFEQLTGLQDVKGKKVSEAIPGTKESHPELFEIYSRVASTGTPERFEIEFKPLNLWLNIGVHSLQKNQFIALFENITERKKAEEELLKTSQENKKLSNLLDISEQPFGIGYPDGTLGYINKAFENLIGYTNHELETKTWSQTLTPFKWREMENKMLEELQRTDKPVKYEKEYIRKDGSIVPIELLVHLVRTENGEPLYYYSFVTDLTQRKKDEDAKEILLEKEQQLREELQASNEDLQSTTEELQTANEELQATTEELQTVNRIIREQRDEVTDTNVNLELKVSERTMQLAAERKRLFDVLETVPIMICLLTEDYHIAFGNRSFRDKFGESKGRPCYEFCFGKSEPCDFCETYKVLETGKPHQWEVSAPDGSIIEAYDFPFTDADGTRLILEMDIDVTEQKQARKALKNVNEMLEAKVTERTAALQESQDHLRELVKKLEVSNRELEQFAYVASHDLQEPLRMVSSFTQLLEMRYKDKLDQDSDDYIDFIVEGANRMKDLIDDLLAFSRLNTEAKPFKRMNLGASVDMVLQYMKASIDESHAEITRDPLPPINGDESQIQQLFQNLISNAIKFHNDETPRIHVSKEDLGNEWKIGVSDNGIGIDPKYQEKIFNIFNRLHTREEYEGTGIGLAICKRIVERHGGEIWVESEEGKGSNFYFTLPK